MFLWAILPIGTICAQMPLDNNCLPPNYCYTKKMDSMAIECMLMQRQKDTIISTYKRDSASFEAQRVSDSIYTVKKVSGLEKKLGRCRKGGKVKSGALFLFGTAFGWFISSR